MKFPILITINLTKEEFQKLKDVKSGEYCLDAREIDKLTDLKLIRYDTNPRHWNSGVLVITQRGKSILKML